MRKIKVIALMLFFASLTTAELSAQTLTAAEFGIGQKISFTLPYKFNDKVEMLKGKNSYRRYATIPNLGTAVVTHVTESGKSFGRLVKFTAGWAGYKSSLKKMENLYKDIEDFDSLIPADWKSGFDEARGITYLDVVNRKRVISIRAIKENVLFEIKLFYSDEDHKEVPPQIFKILNLVKFDSRLRAGKYIVYGVNNDYWNT